MKILAYILALFITCSSLIPSVLLSLSGNAEWHCCFVKSDAEPAKACKAACSHDHSSDTDHSDHDSGNTHPCNPFSCSHSGHVWVATFEYFVLMTKSGVSQKPPMTSASLADNFTSSFWHPPALRLV